MSVAGKCQPRHCSRVALLNIWFTQYLTTPFAPSCLQTPGEGHVEAAANDYENALIMSGQLQQLELDGWLSPFRASVSRLSVEVIREETRIKLALMQASVTLQCWNQQRVTTPNRLVLPSSGWKPTDSPSCRSIMSLRRRCLSSNIPRYSALHPCVLISTSCVFDALVQGAAAPQVKHNEMFKLLETTAEKISGLVRNKRR